MLRVRVALERIQLTCATMCPCIHGRNNFVMLNLRMDLDWKKLGSKPNVSGCNLSSDGL
jgi:hypothetical protein